MDAAVLLNIQPTDTSSPYEIFTGMKPEYEKTDLWIQFGKMNLKFLMSGYRIVS